MAKLKSGEYDGEPIRNVPRSAAGEGPQVIRVAPEDSFFRVLIQRCGE